MDMQIAMLEAGGKDSADLMRILGEQGYYLRIDPDIEPQMFHYAVISRGEIDMLRQVKNVIRNGHVTAITRGVLHFKDSEVAVPGNSLFIDCTATAVPFAQ